MDVLYKGTRRNITCFSGESIMEALIRYGYGVSFVCGGNKICGRCRIRILSGNSEITKADERFFSSQELLDGWRLACAAYLMEDADAVIEIPVEEQFSILTDDFQTDAVRVKYNTEINTEINIGVNDKFTHTDKAFARTDDIMDKYLEEEGTYILACDIGTTTIAMQLIDICREKEYYYAAVNSQRKYGADVISRINASNAGKGSELLSCIIKDLCMGIKELLRTAHVDNKQVERAVFAGNAAMIHLLMGYSCESLGVYPYTPVNIGIIEDTFVNIFKNDLLSCPVVLLPGISAYVGGDIVSGLLALDFDKREKPALFIDLGTNGELVLGCSDGLLVTSVAAGPAFEGGNISCGTGSVKGAVCSVELHGDAAEVKTIGGMPPVGICGTGVVEAVSELLEQGIIDEMGSFEEGGRYRGYIEDGFELARNENGQAIVLTQDDIRELQLAKSAVRAGIEILLKKKGISYSDIEEVYLAGGFGYMMNQDKAVRIGLFPEEFRGKFKAVGNTSLKGAVFYARRDDSKKRIEHILRISSEISLAMEPEFSEQYVVNMFFLQHI